MARSFGQRASRRQEKRAAVSIGGRTTTASGSTDSPSQKGDVRRQFDVRVECKTTEKRSFGLKLSDWQKIKAQAAVAGEEPIMQVEFQGGFGQNTKLAVIDWSYLLELRSREPAEPQQGIGIGMRSYE